MQLLNVSYQGQFINKIRSKAPLLYQRIRIEQISNVEQRALIPIVGFSDLIPAATV